MRKRIYYVELRNRSSSLDDDMIKIKAASHHDAFDRAELEKRPNFDVGVVYTSKQCRKMRPEWYRLLSYLEAK